MTIYNIKLHFNYLRIPRNIQKSEFDKDTDLYLILTIIYVTLGWISFIFLKERMRAAINAHKTYYNH
jgi:hypothetical protein